MVGQSQSDGIGCHDPRANLLNGIAFCQSLDPLVISRDAQLGMQKPFEEQNDNRD